MSEEGHHSRLHIHLGGLFIIIIILLILFKVNLKGVIKSPQFQENISYLEEQATNVWTKYLEKPLKSGLNSLTGNLVNQGVNQIKKSINNITISAPKLNLGTNNTNNTNTTN